VRLIPTVVLLAALLPASSAGAGAVEPPVPIEAGLADPARPVREEAAARARRQARTDPAGVAALADGLDGRARRLLVRAIAGAGTTRAAGIAWTLLPGQADAAERRALLRGLAEGGEAALAAEAPEDADATARRGLAMLRLQWRVEAELVRLKSPTGQTGRYERQFKDVAALGPGVLPILFDIVRDREHPLAGESSGGRYEGIHPQLVRFERHELRSLVAHGLGQVIPRDDEADRTELYRLWYENWQLPEDRNEWERNDLAPQLAFSLFDLGITGPVEAWIGHLERMLRHGGADELFAVWDLGYANMRIGRFEEGQGWYEQIINRPGSVSEHVAAYNLACAFAMRARDEIDPGLRDVFVDAALGWLEKAVHEYQWYDWPWMEADGDLDFIRDQPRYRRLVAELKQRYPDRRKGAISKELAEFLRNARGG